MGLLPGIVAGGVAGGFVGSIRRTSVRSGMVFGFFVLLLPLMVAAYLTGERNLMTPILAFVGYGVGGWAIPRIIYRLQDRPAKKKTGSWEDNF
jgi:4-hydroxybenzoate polyprenyltransferase